MINDRLAIAEVINKHVIDVGYKVRPIVYTSGHYVLEISLHQCYKPPGSLGVEHSPIYERSFNMFISILDEDINIKSPLTSKCLPDKNISISDPDLLEKISKALREYVEYHSKLFYCDTSTNLMLLLLQGDIG